MGSSTTTSIDVEIFGASYSVRGAHDREHLQELARTVDRRMRDIAEHVSTVDTAKIAILAALNLADELVQCRRGQEGDGTEIEERVESLTERLRKSLAPAAR